ncbi:MAG: amidase, partial [Candidatus Obscuribacterales bacterium]|nr:amidase [Steroidobacteraceae bacterium]
SSGGAAAALAAGLTGLEIGGDIGGSSRNPAHYGGGSGHKPTYKLVGATRAAAPGNPAETDLNVSGPLARSAEDLSVAMQYLAGPGLLDMAGWRPTLPPPTKQLRDYRVAIWPNDNRVAVAAEISDRCQLLADKLARLGATVSDSARPKVDTAHSTRVYRQLLDAATNPLTTLAHREWHLLDSERIKIRTQWREYFKDWDIVICPIAATAAFKHDRRAFNERRLDVEGQSVSYFQQLFWAGLVTVGFLPSTAFPTGVNKDGLPIGLQAFGKAYDDLITIDFVRLLSKEIGEFVAPPGFSD